MCLSEDGTIERVALFAITNSLPNVQTFHIVIKAFFVGYKYNDA